MSSDFEGKGKDLDASSLPPQSAGRSSVPGDAALPHIGNGDVKDKGKDTGSAGGDDCGPPPKPNRYLISFQNTSRLGDTCLDESRLKCKAFWKFVDANPKLLKLVKKGTPSPPIPPPRFAACDPCTSKKEALLKACRSMSQEVRSARALSLEVKRRVEEERRRFHARQAAIAELQRKSGQRVFTAKHEPVPNYRNVYADEILETQITLACTTTTTI